MSVDAGSISSSVRIKLDQLNADIAACKTAFDQLGGNLAASATNYANITGKQYFAALKKIQTEIDNITAATRAGALSEKDGVSRMIQLRSQELAILQKRAIAEAGSNKATIDAIRNTEKGLDSLIEKHTMLEKTSVPAGVSMMNAFRNLRDIMQGPVAAAQMIISSIKSIAAEADRLIMGAAESEKAQAILNSTLMATGAIAWTNKTKLNDYAESMSKLTLFEDEAITSMQGVLLGFKNIQGVNFEKASTEILNMAQVMGMDLTSAAQAVGKALDDPVAGMDSLSKQGFKFTEEQKKMLKVMVETGDTAGAQNVILKELSSTYGGAAVAAAEEATGKYQNLKKSIGEVTEELGKAIAASAKWGELSGFINNVADGINKLNKMESLKVKIKEIQDLMGTRGFMSSGIAEQNKQLSQFGLTVEDVGATISIMKDSIAELKKDNKPWSPIIANKAEIKRLEEQIATAESLIPIIKEADRYNKDKAISDKKNADEQAKRDAEQLARIEKLAEEKKKRDEEDKKAASDKKKTEEDAQKAFDDAMKKSRDHYQSLDQQIQLLGKTEKEQQEQKRKWEVEGIRNSNLTLEQKAAEIGKLYELWKLQDQIAQEDASKKLAASSQEYQDKLDALNGVTKDLIANQKALAREAIMKSGASPDEIKAALELLDKYYDALESKRGMDDFRAKLKQVGETFGEVNKYFQKFMDAIDDLTQANYDKQIEAAEELAERQMEILEESQDAQRELLDEEYEHKMELIENDGLTTKQALEKKLADAIAAGDAEAIAAAQKELEKYNAREAYELKRTALEKTQAEEREKLEKDSRKKALKLEYDAAMASWTVSLATATAQGALAVIEAIASVKGNLAGMIAAGIAMGIISGIQVGAVAAAKPKMPAMATGGIILPQAGGVVTRQAENGYPEMDINGGPSGQAFLDRVADTIAEKVASMSRENQRPMFYIGAVIASPDGYRELNRNLEKYGAVEIARRG